MPLYEYACRDCEHRFEEFVLGSARPVCPKCGGRQPRKLLSVFAVGAEGSSSRSRATASEEPGSCGSCGDPRGPGSCAMD